MLKFRVLSAAFGIPLASVLIFVGGLPFNLAVLVLAFLGLRELSQKFHECGLKVVKSIVTICLFANVFSTMLAKLNPNLLLSLLMATWWFAIFGSMLFHILTHPKGSEPEQRGERAISIAATVFAVAYLSLFAVIVALREFEVSISDRVYPIGRDLVFLTIICVWVTDSFAFFFGRSFGKKPLAPKISPGKTLEGSVAGAVAGFVSAWIFAWALISFSGNLASQVWLNLARPLPFAFLALALGTIGQIGDLGKSVLKRSLGIKDFGTIIPGHGGVLDRFDSLLATAPIVYLYAFWVLK
ncbi:MAG: phosphatidate cytidylyltransferase [Armatimonadetes bacterium]|nr:phosphatidate cytidylyltransferase [Armatimonadota bacterium]MDW8029095.1 phosphatidate cytidylyltransferase [Armatimonadota bacterium]